MTYWIKKLFIPVLVGLSVHVIDTARIAKATSTPSQYLIATLTPVVQANNPGASAASVTAYVTQFSTFYLSYILPNLSVDLTTGSITFVVP